MAEHSHIAEGAPLHDGESASERVRTFQKHIDTLIETLQACERALASSSASPQASDPIFVDDFARYVDDLRAHSEALTMSPARELAARYSATLKAAVAILLKIRELQFRDRPAQREAVAARSA